MFESSKFNARFSIEQNKFTGPQHCGVLFKTDIIFLKEKFKESIQF